MNKRQIVILLLLVMVVIFNLKKSHGNATAGSSARLIWQIFTLDTLPNATPKGCLHSFLGLMLTFPKQLGLYVFV